MRCLVESSQAKVPMMPPIEGERGVLAGGYCASFCQVRGDLAFYKETFKFPAWNNADRMCWLCKATSQPDVPWSDFSDGAVWRNRLWTHTTYMEHLRAIGPPPRPLGKYSWIDY